MPTTIPLQPVATTPARVDDTLLPHWGLARRTIHRLCRQSRTINTLVAAAEMRFGREELLSLPQYMALCLTGQCNALCEFCSVTRNRTGIVKKQLPFESLQRFIAPVARVIRMYGLEGNGEPTLYDRFDEIAAAMLKNGSTAYLITNGERLTPESIRALVDAGLDAVNFSLNAATEATHRRVMKLRDFERVLANVRAFVQLRRASARPVVSISMVVTRDNVHEVVDFIRLGEEDLGVDRILIRPLSEIATELSAVEDLRPLVPFESEIVDMLDGVQDYLRWTTRRARVEMVPENFKAVRPDPPGTVLSPPGLERRLFAPRPQSWSSHMPSASVEWTWNRLHVSVDGAARGAILESVPVPVPAGADLSFACHAESVRGRVTLCIGAEPGAALARAEVRGGPFSLEVPAGSHRALAFWLEADGAAEATLTFDRLRTPAAVRSEVFTLPHQGRWEIASPDVRVEWNGPRVHLEGRVTAGPYLLKSYSTWCAPGTPIAVAPHVEVGRGTLGIGVLNADQQQWLATVALPQGHRGAAPIAFDTGTNDRVCFVLYAAADGVLDARIDWGATLEPLPARRAEPAPPAPPDPASVPAQPVSGGGTPPVASRRPVAARLGRALAGPVKYHCQKPWTDLHNFTVDGRMDVCCIATGESQARYALGNLTTQSFQDVWNGPVAREFRRTVNSDAPLPPCQRCPMAYAYQGPLFNPAGAERRVRKALDGVCRYLPFGRRINAAGARVLPPLVSLVFFRGFKR